MTDKQTEKFLKRMSGFRPPRVRKAFHIEESSELSKSFEKTLLSRFKEHPLWQEVGAVVLGSWARGELCPRSDIDMLFTGAELKAAEFIEDFQKQGLKLRHRIPEDPSDWSVGVEDFDVIALLRAKAFFPAQQQELERQQELIRKKGKLYARKLFKAMVKERKERERRHDSVTNYIEPNLKFGPGGLRDLDQALMISSLFPDKSLKLADKAKKLSSLKTYLLLLRQWLHLNNYDDMLVAQAQKDMAEFFQYSSIREMMSEVQYVLSEVSFLTDCMIEGLSSKVKKPIVIDAKIELAKALKALQVDPSISRQEEVRNARLVLPPKKEMGKLLLKYFNVKSNEKFIQALFRSRVLSRSIKDLLRVEGLVQHDQYHRFSVDAHTLQAVREVLRVYKRPGRLGKLKTWAKKLSLKDYQILLWSALYHDLGKGRAGSHSVVGSKMVIKDFTSMSMPLRLTTDVAWMVQNHLLISGAAFRQNPQAPGTWQWLFQRGVRNKRIPLLTVFTAIDIRATNIDAWTDWKESLLNQLAKNLSSPEASKVEELISVFELKKIKVHKEFIANMDPVLIQTLPMKLLKEELIQLSKAKESIPIKYWMGAKKDIWVRLHRRKDRKGLFVSYVGALHAAGANILEAFVMTDKKYGVYDWFRVRTSKPPKSFQAMLKALINKPPEEPPDLKFEAIELVRQEPDYSILSFRGRDRRGALYSAASQLFSEGFSITWARVNTWGRQIDDVFCVKAKPDLVNEFIQRSSTKKLHKI